MLFSTFHNALFSTKDDLSLKLWRVICIDAFSLFLLFQEHDIYLLVACLQVMSVRPAKKVVMMNDGTSEHYDQLLIASGCR